MKDEIWKEWIKGLAEVLKENGDVEAYVKAFELKHPAKLENTNIKIPKLKNGQ